MSLLQTANTERKATVCLISLQICIKKSFHNNPVHIIYFDYAERKKIDYSEEIVLIKKKIS